MVESRGRTLAGTCHGAGYSTYPLLLDGQTYLVNVAGSDRGSGIFRTTDGGASWHNVSWLGPNGSPLVASDGSIYWPVGDALAKSSDHGLTWSRLGGGFVNGLHPIEVAGGQLVTAQADTLVVSSDGGATWNPFGAPLPYTPAGVVYSENQKAVLVWHSDCGTRVLPDAIQKLNYDFSSAAAATVARPGLPASAGPARVQLLANWVSPTYLAAGQSVTVHQDAFADQSMNLSLSVDVLNSQGEAVLHSSLDNQALAARQTTPFEVTIALPTSLPSGTYVVKTTAVGPDGNQYAASQSAGQFVAIALPPTPPPVASDDTADNSDQPQPAPADDE